MRWLDRWLGVPLCFLLSLGARWRNRCSLAPVGRVRPRRILCIQLVEMGSLVLAGPAVHWLQTRGALPYFVSFERNRDCLVLAGLAPVERMFLWRTGNARVFVIDLLRFMRWSWQLHFEGSIDFEPCSRFSALLGFLAGARLRSGYTHEGTYRGRLHTLPVPYRSDRHMSENCLALAAALLPGAAIPILNEAEQAWRERLPPAGDSVGRERVGALLTSLLGDRAETGSLLLLNPNAGDLLPQRRWPLPRYVQLAKLLLEQYPEICIGFIGSPDEAATVQELTTAVGSPHCVSLAGTLSIAELPDLYAHCRLLVSNDSGPAHIASLTTTPTVVLFGPETPLLYRPLGKARPLYAALPCSPCVNAANQRRCGCANNLCMQAISVDSVLAQVVSILQAAGDHDRRPASADFSIPNMADVTAGPWNDGGYPPSAPQSQPIQRMSVELDR
jgi:ADP-heptose:LPS heptosyltransferase